MKRGTLDRRSLGLTLSRLANAGAQEAFAHNLYKAGKPERCAYRVGITGPPGAGKSSLAGRLALARCVDARLGVLAIDPTSPKSGGAILGDRIRMDELADTGELYIRSFGSRSSSDGLTDNLPELLATMDDFGFDEIIVETVGVGQAEYAVRPQVDTLVLALMPESGDVVQAMKAGIMEVADILVVNKADLPGARKMAAELKRVAVLRKPERTGWRPPVLLTCTDDADSVGRLSAAIDQHRRFLDDRLGLRHGMLAERAKYRIRRLIERDMKRILDGFPADCFDAPLIDQYRSVVTELADRCRRDKSQ